MSCLLYVSVHINLIIVKLVVLYDETFKCRVLATIQLVHQTLYTGQLYFLFLYSEGSISLENHWYVFHGQVVLVHCAIELLFVAEEISALFHRNLCFLFLLKVEFERLSVRKKIIFKALSKFLCHAFIDRTAEAGVSKFDHFQGRVEQFSAG